MEDSALLNDSKSAETTNDRFKSILDAMYDAFVTMDASGKITDWNRQAELTFGWSKSEAIGQPLDALIIPERFKAQHKAGLERFLKTGKSQILGKRIELPALHKSGHEIEIELSISAVTEGNHFIFGAFLKDISDRRKSEKYRQVQTEVTRILIESTSIDEVFTRSIQAICTELGWKWGAFWRFDPSDEKLFLSHHFSLDPELLQSFENKSRSLRCGIGEGLPGLVWKEMTASWTSRFTDTSMYPRAEIGKKVGIEGGVAFPIRAGEHFLGVLEFLNENKSQQDPNLPHIMSDMVSRLGFFIQRKEAEEQLRQSEVRYSTLVAGIKDYAIISLDTEGLVTTWNRGAAQIKGYEEHEIVGHSFTKFYPRISIEQNFPAYELKMAREQGRFEDEGWRVKKDGSTFWANVIINPILDRSGELVGYSKVTRDMTERKIAEQNLSRLNEELEKRVADRTQALQQALLAAEQASHAKSSFLANMSHEIRTPLGVVLGYSELLMDPKVSEADKSTFMTTIKRNGELLSNVINDILDLSKVEIGKLEIEKLDTPISDILIDIHSLLELKAREKSIQLNVVFDGLVPHKIKTDPLRLRQILINIIGNAIKFTDHGFVEAKLKVISIGENLPRLAFIITDSGPGISPEQENKLFQPFSQADISTRRRFGGTGLGLTLSRHLAELLGGTVELTRSELGHGSTFTVTIDPGPIESEAITSLSQTAPASSLPAGTTTQRIDGVQILVADDSPDNQVLVTRILKLAGAQVDTADNGLVALGKAQIKNYDVVLMDLQMPTMDGYEATRELRKLGYHAPIVALTAHALKEEREYCLNNGFDDHVSKPINRNLLIDSIYRLVTSRH